MDLQSIHRDTYIKILHDFRGFVDPLKHQVNGPQIKLLLVCPEIIESKVVKISVVGMVWRVRG